MASTLLLLADSLSGKDYFGSSAYTSGFLQMFGHPFQTSPGACKVGTAFPTFQEFLAQKGRETRPRSHS